MFNINTLQILIENQLSKLETEKSVEELSEILQHSPELLKRK